jgi:hypothetical protein
MSAPPPGLETLTHVAPFGLGLWDTATARLIADGLTVRVYALAGAKAVEPRLALANQRGIFVATGLRGLREFEAGPGDEAFWSAAPTPRPFLAEVRDTLARFTPFVLHVEAPSRGPVLPGCADELWPAQAPPASPPSPPRYVPLFASPSRPVPAGMTAVRAALVDAGTGGPAGFAMLEVRESGRLVGRGIADQRGEVAAVFAYPEPPVPPPASPPAGASGAQPLARQTWRIDIVVRYRRDLPRYRPDPGRSALPDLCEVVRQPPAAVATGPPSPGTLVGATLRYGEDLVLGADAGATQLLISPA